MSSIAASSALGALILWLSAAASFAQNGAEPERRGELLLNSNCSECHAVGRAGPSPHASAPPFRTLGQRYPIESLAEALAEGLYTGHPDMPEFIFEVSDVSAILAYLQSIQEPPANR